MSKSDSRRSNWLQTIHQVPGGSTSTDAAEQRRLTWEREQAALAEAAAEASVASHSESDSVAPSAVRSTAEMTKKELIKILLADPNCALSEADLEKRRATELREIVASLPNP
jgi:hypothetical protein